MMLAGRADVVTIVNDGLSRGDTGVELGLARCTRGAPTENQILTKTINTYDSSSKNPQDGQSVWLRGTSVAGFLQNKTSNN